MKLFWAIIITAVLSHMLQLILPWWIVFATVIPSILIFRLSLGQAMWSGVAGVFLSWLVYGFVLSAANDHLLAGKIGQLIGGLSAFVYLLLSSVFGGIMGLAGAFFGWSIKQIFTKAVLKV